MSTTAERDPATGPPPEDADELLRSTPFFRNLAPHDLDLLASHCQGLTVPAGTFVIREDDRADGLFVVSNGRLRVFVGDQPRGEIGSGEAFGELALLAEGTRTASVQAIRDSELLWLPSEDFDRIVLERPQVLREITRVVIGRLRVAERGGEVTVPTVSFAVVSLNVDSAEYERIIDGLVEAMGEPGTVACVGERDAPAEASRSGWARRLEADHRQVIYRLPDGEGPWFDWAIRRADRILLLASAARGRDAHARATSARVIAAAPLTNAQLVLVHPPSAGRPRGSHLWAPISNRPSGGMAVPYLHLRSGSRDGLRRIGRLLTGRGYGLVMSGGGARGFAHLGVMQALDESGIPVDAIGGTSIGAIMGAFRAFDWDHERRLARAIEGMIDGGRLFHPTLPIVAFSSPRRIQEMISSDCDGTDIEDCWLPFFCVAASLKRAEAVVIDEGDMSRALRASISLPAIMPPVRNGDDLLVDGGVLNNLPLDEMRVRLGGGMLMSVNLEVNNEIVLPSGYSESTPAWRLLLQRRRHKRAGQGLPSPVGVLMRSLDLANIRSRREMALSYSADVDFRPPVDGVSRLDFASGRELTASAYRYSLEHLRQAEIGPPSP